MLQVVGRAVNHEALQSVLLRILLSGDLSRAQKLLSAIPNTPIGFAMRAVLVQAQGMPSSTDAMVARTALETTFTDSFAIAVSRVRASAFLTGVALVAAVASIVAS